MSEELEGNYYTAYFSERQGNNVLSIYFQANITDEDKLEDYACTLFEEQNSEIADYYCFSHIEED